MAPVRRPLPLLAALPQPAAALLSAGAALLWLLWPLLPPLLAPAPGTTLVVVFDGYHRLDAALARTRGPLLLLSCPLTGQPTAAQRRRAIGRPFFVDHRGQDSIDQLTILARWLRQPPASLPAIGRIQLVSDSHHLPRLLPAARLALGDRGLQVASLMADADRPAATRQPHPGPWLILRDWLRVQLWRATGTHGDLLLPALRRHKRRLCG